MSARLSSILVAGGVVLVGIQCGSLRSADLDPAPVAVLQGGAFHSAAGAGDLLQLAIPGYQGVPRVQVLAHPARVVVDLPGVNRGVALSRKALQSLTSSRVIRWRVAQFSVLPEVTRVVLEVVPGTKVQVSGDAAGVSILLAPGRGAIQARLAQPALPPAPVATPSPWREAPVPADRQAVMAPDRAAVMAPDRAAVMAPDREAVMAPDREAVMADAPPVPAGQEAESDPMSALTAPDSKPAAALPPVAQLKAPAPDPVPQPVAALDPVPQPVAAPDPVPQPVAAPVPVPQPVASPEPVAQIAAPAPQPVAQIAAPAPEVAKVAAPAPEPVAQVAAPAPEVAKVAAPAPEVAQVAAPAPEAPAPVAKPAAAKASPAPLVPLPAVNASYQTLPALTVKALTPATAMTQDQPLVPSQATRKAERGGGRTLGDSGQRYTGSRMTIDVVGTDLTSFLRIIADTAHLNLIVDSDVQGIYTFKFTDTPWDQVLDVILKHAGLGKEVSNGIIRVAKVEKLQKEEEDRKRLEDAKALSGETQSVTRPLSFAKASEAKAILDKILTKRGSIIIDDRTNTLIITDLPRNLPLIDDLIAQLDVQIQQVQIEARVVEATKNWEQAFGVQWPTSNTGSAAITTGSSATAATWGSTNGTSWNSINNLATNGSNALVGSFSPGQVGVTDIPSPAGQFWLSFLSNRMSVNVILQALETQGVVKVISSPKVVTQNNKKAKILSGTKIPYPSVQSGSSSGSITVAFADANLSLEVTPQITNDGTIIMDINVEKDDADFSQQVQGTPTITTKSIQTQVLVKDGGTAIMGGVTKNTNSTSTTGVPFLANLPLIGWLFRNKIDSDANDELLIFITPHVVKN